MSIRLALAFVAAALIIGSVGATQPAARAAVVAAPLAQATATSVPTSTPTNTPTATATRIPGDQVFRPFGDPPTDFRAHANGDGTFDSGVWCNNCPNVTVTIPNVGAAAYTTPVAYVATVVVTPNSTPLVPANAARTFLNCSNDSDTPIYIKPGMTPAVGTGIRVNANGGAYEMTAKDGNLYTGPVYAVATATGKSMTCVEGSP